MPPSGRRATSDPAERRARLIAHAREVGIGTRYARVARALQRAGDAATALELLEEGVATGTYETGVWNDLYEGLCDAAQATTVPAERARLVDRAVEVLRRSAELGADPRVMAANGAPELFAGHKGFEALVGAAAAAGGR